MHQGFRLIDPARWLLLGIVAAADWLWGGTRPWTQDLIAQLLMADLMIFCVGLILLKRMPRIAPVALWAILILLAQGWLLSWNAYPGPGGLRVLMNSTPAQIPWFPAFIDQGQSVKSMLLMTGLLGAFCISCDMSANSVWLMRLWKFTTLLGLSIVILGLAQRFTNAPAIFWNVYENDGSYFFSVFRYHANAGSFINIMIPLMAPLAVLSVILKWGQAERVVWITGTLATCAAAFVNASRAAMVVTLILIFLGACWVWMLSVKTGSRMDKRTLLLLMAAGVAILLVLSLSFGMDQALTRWGSFRGIAMNADRTLTYRVIIEHLIPRTGLFGIGPGNFDAAFGSLVQARDLPVRGHWDMAHNDYLQALVEWGWLGTACWGIILGGALLQALSMIWDQAIPLENKALGFGGSIALTGVLLHACVDFPLQITSIQLSIALLCGILWGCSSNNQARKRKRKAVS